MKLQQSALKTHLQKTLAPIYLISGDEPLLVQESCMGVREKADQCGYGERQVLTVEANFDWNLFWRQARSLSLFSQKRLLELRLSKNGVGAKGSKALLAYCQAIDTDLCVLVVMPKLEARSTTAKWFKAIENEGVVVQIWPIDRKQMPQWITQRLQDLQMTADPVAIELLVGSVEGNLLAADQAVEKLYLSYGAGHLSLDEVSKTIHNTAHFNVFQLLDSALTGDAERVVMISHSLQQARIEPAIVLWAIARELRLLAHVSYDMKQGKRFEDLCQSYHVHYQRQQLFRQVLAKYSTQFFYRLLRGAKKVDEVIKGVKVAHVWQELLQLYLALAGVHLLAAKRR
ncbi:MAG: DNA polymerase III subunit delta [Gammaproteobacteria bacterium]